MIKLGLGCQTRLAKESHRAVLAIHQGNQYHGTLYSLLVVASPFSLVDGLKSPLECE